MIKRYDVREIPKELYSEGYKYLEFEVIGYDGTFEPLCLKLTTTFYEELVIDNLHIHKEEQGSIMKDFLKSITLEPGIGCNKDIIQHDFEFIKDFYGLHAKKVHTGDRSPILRFVEEEQSCEEEEILDPITIGGRI